MSTTTHKKTVVIVGGGLVGAAIAKDLSGTLDASQHRLVMITASPKLVHYPALVRTVTTAEGKLEDRVFMSYDKLMKGSVGEVKVGEVVSFTTDNVSLASGETVNYDVLVLTPGNKWAGPLSLPTAPKNLQDHLDSWRGKIEKAKDIVLVGGGAVGVELSGELADFYKGKNVTLVHNGRSLLNDTYPDRVRNTLLGKVQRLGIHVVLDDSAENLTPSADGTVTLKSGKVLQADLVIPTFGGTPNTDFIKSSLGEGVLTSTKHVKVLPTLQLPGFSNILAAGDVIDWAEQKQAAKAPAHASVVVKNVTALLNGQKPTAEYKGSFELILITLGRSGGLAYFGVLWGLIFGDWFARLLKSKSLMIGMKEKEMGLA